MIQTPEPNPWTGDVPVVVRWRGDAPPLLGVPRATFRVMVDGEGQPVGAMLDPASGRAIEPPVPLEGDPLRAMDQLLAAFRGRGGGWMGLISYDLGAVIEPAARWRQRETLVPLIELHRLDSWAEVSWPEVRSWRDSGEPRLVLEAGERQRYVEGVRRVIEYIRAGDVFQANLAHVLRGRVLGSAREAFLAVARQAGPVHGGYVELARTPGVPRAAASWSPELFLRIDGDRIRTEPMKGTRPGSGSALELEGSAKDQAELNMIVDLMRNDLGRVCRLGSIAVDERREIRRHAGASGGVWQATRGVSGVLRAGVTLGDVLRATFPPGSVTGAPKIRAMQIIDELEGQARGAYCGSIAWIPDQGPIELSVTIRTATIWDDGRLEYPVGAGIVADSDPEAEWAETLAKAGILGTLGAQPT